MKLISEEIQQAEYLVEEKNGKKEYKIKGVFLQSNIKNRNGRIYPKEILDRRRLLLPVLKESRSKNQRANLVVD